MNYFQYPSSLEDDEHGGHRTRLRNRVLRHGLDGVQPHEALEFLLCYAIPRQDVNFLSHALMKHFGSLRAIMEAAPEALMRVEGLGRHAAGWLALNAEAAAYCELLAMYDCPALTNRLSALRYALQIARTAPRPCCVQLCTDPDGRLLFYRVFANSALWGEAEYMRAAMEDALSSAAAGVILLLYPDVYPARPQEYDIAHARKYAEALRASSCLLLDLLIVDGARILSLRDADLLPTAQESKLQRRLRERYAAASAGENEPQTQEA